MQIRSNDSSTPNTFVAGIDVHTVKGELVAAPRAPEKFLADRAAAPRASELFSISLAEPPRAPAKNLARHAAAPKAAARSRAGRAGAPWAFWGFEIDDAAAASALEERREAHVGAVRRARRNREADVAVA